jgi:AraC-like DNA-binding protein
MKNWVRLGELVPLYQLDRNYISRVLREQGIVTDKRVKIIPEDESQMIKLYMDELWSLDKIANHFGIERRQVSRRLKKLGVTIRANLPYNFPDYIYQDWAEYYQMILQIYLELPQLLLPNISS